LVAIAWAGAAYAQSQAPTSSPSAQAGDTDVTIDDIIVTAQRRSERLVDVPISISVASSDDLQRAGPATLESLTKVTPGIYLQRATFGLSPTIRGIGSTLPDSNNEQNVAVYVDNIYYSVASGNVFDLASVSGVEVLKGPQGTLFGRNATGGAILIHTLDPGFDMTGKFNLSYERFNQVRASAYVNVPLGDKVAVNGSVAYRYSNGSTHDLKTNAITNEGNNFTARGKLLLQPTDNFSIIFVAAHADYDDPSGSDSRNFTPARALPLFGGAPIATDRFHSSFNTKQYIRTSTDEFSARAKLELDSGTISSFTSYQDNQLDGLSDLDLSYASQNLLLSISNKTFTQEINYASSKDEPFSFIVGAYYFHNKSGSDLFSNGAPLTYADRKADALAGYLDGTYKFGKLSLIAGIRYSWEKRETNSAPNQARPAPYTRLQEAKDKQWTPRLGLQYELSDHSNVYATYSKGFKSGVFDATTSTGPGVTPEKIDAFEAGLKSSSREISFNVAGFYYDYKDAQVNTTILVSGIPVTQLINVPKSRSYGAEADVTYRVNDNFDLRAAVAYTHARYIKFPNAPTVIDAPFIPGTTTPNPLTLGGLIYMNFSTSANGNHMVRAPALTASGTMAFHTPIGGNKEFELTVSPYYSSRVYFTFDNLLSQKSYVTLDATAALTIDEKLKLSVFGRNLTDKEYYSSLGASAFSLKAGKYGAPRTYGISLGYTF